MTGGPPVRDPGALLLPLGGDRAGGDGRAARGSSAALAGVLRSEHAHFSAALGRGVGAAQKLLLAALAVEEPGRPLAAAYRRRHGCRRRPTSSARSGRWSSASWSAASGGGYPIAEPFLAEWIGANIA